MQASLIVVKSDGSTAAVPLTKTRVVVGRDVSCQIRVPKAEVSREHCEFLVAGDRVAVRDLGSSNGSFVNGERVSEANLSAGDIVTIGPCSFVISVDGTPSEAEAPMLVARLAQKVRAGRADESDSFAGLGALVNDPDSSSLMDFDIDLDDDDDDQPAL